MEYGYPSSKTHDAACLERASLATPSSCQSTNDELQQGPRADHTALVQTHPHSAQTSLGGNLRLGAFHRCRPLFHSLRRYGSRRSTHTIAHQSLVKLFADPRHLSSALSSSPSSDVSKTIGKAFDEWTKTNCRIGQK